MQTPKKKQLTIGKKITELRKLKGLTQDDLGKRIGISRRAMIYYENETNRLTIEKLKVIARGLNVTLYELINGEEPEISNVKNFHETQFHKRFKKIEQLTKNDQKAVIRYINALALKKNK